MQIEIPQTLYERLSQHAYGFADSPANVIERLLDEKEGTGAVRQNQPVEPSIFATKPNVKRKGKMTTEQIEAVYSYAKDVYRGKIRTGIAQDELENNHGMNRRSAFLCIRAFTHMMKGKIYKFAINFEAVRYGLNNIQNDFGDEALGKALAALRAHIDYRENLGYGPLHGLEKIHDEYSARLNG